MSFARCCRPHEFLIRLIFVVLKVQGAEWPAQVCSRVFSSWLKYIADRSAAEQNSKQTLRRQIEMPESTFVNPFQLFPITRLLRFRGHITVLRPIHGKLREREKESAVKRITLAIQSFPLATSSKKGQGGEMWFSLGIVGLNQVKGQLLKIRITEKLSRMNNSLFNSTDKFPQS